MHDFHLAQQILKAVLDYSIKNSLKNVSKINLKLGSIVEHEEIILPENLIYNFKLLAEETIAKNAEIKIEMTTGENWELVSIEGDN